MFMSRVLRASFVLIGLAASFAACSQAYPNRPIRFVIGFTPPTIVDIIGRPVANELEKRLGQPVLLEFKAGANGTIAAKSVATAPPDGYNFFLGNTSGINPLFNRNNGVDAGKDFAPVAIVFSAPFFIYSSGKLPARDMRELIAYSKSHPDELTHGATSATLDLIMKMLSLRTGINTRSIPYKSSPQIALALISGEVSLTPTSNVGLLSQYVQAGTIRNLFVTAGKRSGLAPNVPTAAEAGVQNFELAQNYGLWAPPGTPREIVQKISESVAAALKVAEVGDKVRAEAEPVGSTPEEQLRAFNNEMKFWNEAVRAANFSPP